MSFTVVVDRGTCQDHGQCVFAAPAVFALDDEGRQVLLQERPDEDERSGVQDAVDMCPVQALRIEG
jgi:ferredoxin